MRRFRLTFDHHLCNFLQADSEPALVQALLVHTGHSELADVLARAWRLGSQSTGLSGFRLEAVGG